MACPEFEDRLIEYADIEGEARACVDTHLAECAGCREFLEALRVVDTQLAARFVGREVSAAFAPAVRRRVEREASAHRLSFVPEVLDFVGWGAIPYFTEFDARGHVVLDVSFGKGVARITKPNHVHWVEWMPQLLAVPQPPVAECPSPISQRIPASPITKIPAP